MLLGSSNPSQLTENLGAIQVPHTHLTLKGCFSHFVDSYGVSLFFCFCVCCVGEGERGGSALQVIPKMTAGIALEVDHILGNRPHSKKDYHH